MLPDGSIHNGLSALKKDNRGYSIDQLLIGAEGTLGVITAVALRLAPAISARAVAWAGVESPARALDLLRFLQARTDSIEGFELIPADSLSLVLKHIPNRRPPLEDEHRWHVLVEATTADPAHDISAELQDLLAEALQHGIIQDAVIAGSEAQAEAFWKIRESLSEAERAEGFAEQDAGGLAAAASRITLFSAVDETVEEGSGGDDGGRGEQAAAIAQLEAKDAAMRTRGPGSLV